MKNELRQQQLFSLEGKDIWVIGGAGYLGQPTVARIEEFGAKVLCIDIENKARDFVKTAKLGDAVTPVSLDIRDSAARDSFIRKQIQKRGIPHGLVNLTATSTRKNLENLNEEEFNDVNHGIITTTFLTTRIIGLAMSEARRGSIIMFSSMYGMVSPYPEVYKGNMNKNPIEYGIGKAGLIHMTRYLAIHWGRSNVRCNCISPGPFPNLDVQKKHPGFIERLSKKSPMGRIGKSDEVPGAVVFLLSDAASYITGQNIQIDGGWTCW